jgi:hypothetical protein
VHARVTCALSCRLTAIVRDAAGRRVGRAELRLAPGAARGVRVRLTAAGVRAGRVQVAFRAQDSLGERVAVTRRRVADASR